MVSLQLKLIRFSKVNSFSVYPKIYFLFGGFIFVILGVPGFTV